MAVRHLPVRPDLTQLRNQAKDLLGDIRGGDPSALTLLTDLHPERVVPEKAALADAQLVLARSYGVRSWPRLKQGLATSTPLPRKRSRIAWHGSRDTLERCSAWSRRRGALTRSCSRSPR